MSSVCGGSRFTRLGDGRGFVENFQIFISLMDFITYFFHCVRRKSPRFLQKLSFDKKLAEKPKSSVFETISGFLSSIGAHINFPNCKIPLDLFSRGEQARN